MVKHTFLDKCCTIIKDSDLNTGLNPVAELNYGKGVTRALIHFNIDELKALYEDKTFADLQYLKHTLKLTNCGSVNNDIHDMNIYSTLCDKKERATSFDILLFKLPNEWDGGKGVDFITDFWITENYKLSNSGCNWFQRVNGGNWENEGIYTSDFLSKEYDKFSAGEDSVIVARQHFDVGNENFEFDITEYVNKLIKGEEKNFGLGLSFSPMTETLKMKHQQYVGFFTCHTNTFFHPYLESSYEDVICDERDMFNIGKTNRLYLYCYDGNEYFNLDEIPTCVIEGYEDKDIVVKQQGKGIYYAEFSFKKGEIEPNTVLYDKWLNLSVNGEKMDDEEFEFVVLPPIKKFNIDNSNRDEYTINTDGIHEDEVLNIGEMRKVYVTFRKKYTTNQYTLSDNCFYRIYVKEGNKEIDVFDWHPIEKRFLTNVFYVNTNDLIPNKYFIDVKDRNQTYKEICSFKVVSNITQRYM